MRGTITKKKNKYYIVLEMGRDENGKRKRKWIGGFDTKKAAQAALTEKLYEIQKGTYVEPTKETVASYMEQWLKDKETQIRPSTLRQYVWLVRRHIIPKLGHHELAKLSPAHLQKFYTDCQTGEKPLSKRSIRHAHFILHDALDRALKWGLVARNVANAVEPPRPNRIEMKTWNEKHIVKFLKAASEHRWFAAFVLAIMTGMRKGEILGLRWQDIDLSARSLSVVQTLSYTGKGYIFQEPKTTHGKRSIALSDEVVELLRKHKTRQAEERLKAGSLYQDSGLVFQTNTGAPIRIRDFDTEWQRLLQSADVPKIRFHDLRHTHATLMLKQGVHPKVVSERLGHSSIGITLDTYSHVIPGLQEQAAKLFSQTVLKGLKF